MMRYIIVLWGVLFFSLSAQAQTEKQKEQFAKQIFSDFKKGNLDEIQSQFMDGVVLKKMITAFEGKEIDDIPDKEMKQMTEEIKKAEMSLGHSLKIIREELSDETSIEKATYLSSKLIQQEQWKTESISLNEMRIFFQVQDIKYSIWFGMNIYDKKSKQFYLLTDNLKLLKGDEIDWFYDRIDNARAMEALRDEVNAKAVIVDESAYIDAPVIYDKGTKEPSLKVRGKNKQEPNKIYTAVEQIAEFPGGEDRLMEWLVKNVEFPTSAKDNGISGIVYIDFVINQDGSHSDYKIVRDIGGGCGQAAIKALKKMPKWVPAKNNGQAVRSQYILPIRFETDE